MFALIVTADERPRAVSAQIHLKHREAVRATHQRPSYRGEYAASIRKQAARQSATSISVNRHAAAALTRSPGSRGNQITEIVKP